LEGNEATEETVVPVAVVVFKFDDNNGGAIMAGASLNEFDGRILRGTGKIVVIDCRLSLLVLSIDAGEDTGTGIDDDAFVEETDGIVASGNPVLAVFDDNGKLLFAVTVLLADWEAVIPESFTYPIDAERSTVVVSIGGTGGGTTTTVGLDSKVPFLNNGDLAS
jgi:hypothetical protein